MEIINAKVDQAVIGFEGHGLLCVAISFAWGSVVQGPGALGVGASISREAQDPFMANLVRAVLLTLELDEWAKVKGQYCRIKSDGGRIVAMGHICLDRWMTFSPLSYTDNP